MIKIAALEWRRLEEWNKNREIAGRNPGIADGVSALHLAPTVPVRIIVRGMAIYCVHAARTLSSTRPPFDAVSV